MPAHRLLLVRHAQAASGPVDMDRPLTDQGAQHARAIGGWLAQAGLLPDRVLVSPARRALDTWEGAAAALVPRPDPIVDPRIFDNTVEALLAAIRETAEDVPTLAVVGHNPAVGELAAVLGDGQGSGAAQRALGAGFGAGGVAVFTLRTPFAAIEPGAATLSEFAVP